MEGDVNTKPCAARGNILREMVKLIVGWNKASTCAVILQMKLRNFARQLCNMCIFGRKKNNKRKFVKIEVQEID